MIQEGFAMGIPPGTPLYVYVYVCSFTGLKPSVNEHQPITDYRNWFLYNPHTSLTSWLSVCRWSYCEGTSPRVYGTIKESGVLTPSVCCWLYIVKVSQG